jgi:hypothetical protein
MHQGTGFIRVHCLAQPHQTVSAVETVTLSQLLYTCKQLGLFDTGHRVQHSETRSLSQHSGAAHQNQPEQMLRIQHNGSPLQASPPPKKID